MREIKLRAWDKYEKCWIPSKQLAITAYGELITYDEVASDYVQTECFVKDPIDVIFMQYTGLKDCKGIEIYEGDIIEYDYNGNNYRIEFINAEFVARRFYEDIENLYPTEFDYGNECEVIGNIYENPELLESK